MNKKILKAYDIRGIYPIELDETTVNKISLAFGTLFGKRIVVAGDARASTPQLKESLIEGLMSAGCEVIDIGSVATPVLIFSIRYLSADGGIMVTASHNPKEYNGLKFFDANSLPIVRDGGYDKLIKVIEEGAFKKGKGRLEQASIIEDYMKFVIEKSGLKSLAGKKIVVDCGNGIAGIIYPVVFERLGAEVVKLFCEPDGSFPNHPADPSQKANLQELVRKVKEVGADFGFGYDGDGDRIGVVDKNGRILDTILVFSVLINRAAKEHPGTSIVYDALTSQKISDLIEIKKSRPAVAKVGHPFIIKKMVELRARLGGELSGHFYHLQENYSDDDALFATLKFLGELEESGRTIEDYEEEIPKYFSAVSEEQRILVDADQKDGFIEGLARRFNSKGMRVDMLDGVKVFFDRGWAIFRPSNTEPKIAYAYESQDAKEFEEIKKFVEDVLEEAPKPISKAKPVAVILAGGASSRFLPLSDKNSLKFMGRSLVEHHIENLNAVGITDIIIITSPTNNKLVEETTSKYKGIRLTIQQEPKGMGNAILSAEDLILNKFSSRPIYILNGDDVFEVDWHSKILQESEKENIDALVGAYQVSSYFPGGYLIVDKENRISGIKEKPGAGNEPSNFVNAVAHLYKNPKKLIDYIKKEYENTAVKTDDHYERAMDWLMQEHCFRAVPYPNWSTVKFPWHVLDVANYFLKRIKGKNISGTAQIHPSAVIRDNVVIEDGAKIFEGAIIGPNTYIGKNAIVGNHALVRESIVNDSCVVGYNAEICRSFVNDNCWFHSNYIGDSVIDSNVSFGSGAITANLRLDEGDISMNVKNFRMNTWKNKLGAVIGRNVRIGINASIMPGVKIGENSFVGSHVNLDKDLAPGAYCYVKQEHQIKENLKSLPSRDEFREKLLK
jgi:phosphomannomutase/phosphoglucomutase